jgi:hypothetical protein
MPPWDVIEHHNEDEETVDATQRPRFFFSLLGDYRAIHMFNYT